MVTKNENGTINIPADEIINVVVDTNKDGTEYTVQKERYTFSDTNSSTVIKEVIEEPYEVYTEYIMQDIERGHQYLVWNEKGVIYYQLITIESLIENIK